MIDEKKIQEAAAGRFNVGGLVNTVERIAFKEGIDWFKKALWHTEDEIPGADRPILVKDWKLKDRYSTFDTTEELNLEDFDKEHQWEAFCAFADADFTWCYIEDLLPKGGEK